MKKGVQVPLTVTRDADDKVQQATKALASWRKGVSDSQKQYRSSLSASRSDGSTAAYYELPDGAKELQDLISYRDMNSQIGEIFRAAYRYGQASHSDKLRDAKKIRFYINAEIERIEKYES